MRKNAISPLRLVALIFLCIGALFFTIGMVFTLAQGARANMEQVNGVIVTFDANGNPLIEYTWDDQIYQIRGHTRTSSQRIGSDYPLRVDPLCPQEAKDNAGNIIAVVFSVVGGVLLLVGIILAAMRPNKKKQELLSSGIRTAGIVRDVRLNTAVRVNGHSPYVITAECINPVSGELQTLKSHSVWQTSLCSGDIVTIAFDAGNANRYFFDLTGGTEE